MEAEKEKNSEIKVTSLKVKAAVIGEDQSGIQDLKQKIDALTTEVKSSTQGGAKTKQNNGGTTPQKMKDNGKITGIHTKDEDWQLHQLGHSSLDRNFSNVTIVGDGGIVISNARVRGASTGGP